MDLIYVLGFACPLQLLPLHILADTGVADVMAFLKKKPVDVGALQTLLAHTVVTSAVILFLSIEIIDFGFAYRKAKSLIPMVPF